MDLRTLSKRDLRKENRKDNPKDPSKAIQALNDRLAVKEATVVVLRKECDALQKKYEKKRNAESAKRVQNQRLESRLKKLELSEKALRQEVADLMAERVPIVAAVVMKCVYKNAAKIATKEHAGQDDRTEKMRHLEAGFKEIGYDKPELVAEFIDMVSSSPYQ